MFKKTNIIILSLLLSSKLAFGMEELFTEAAETANQIEAQADTESPEAKKAQLTTAVAQAIAENIQSISTQNINTDALKKALVTATKGQDQLVKSLPVMDYLKPFLTQLAMAQKIQQIQQTNKELEKQITQLTRQHSQLSQQTTEALSKTLAGQLAAQARLQQLKASQEQITGKLNETAQQISTALVGNTGASTSTGTDKK